MSVSTRSLSSIDANLAYISFNLYFLRLGILFLYRHANLLLEWFYLTREIGRRILPTIFFVILLFVAILH